MYREIIRFIFAGADCAPVGVPIVLTSAKITVDEMIKDIERGV